MKMRETETGKIPMPQAQSAPQKTRRTIKLKPLKAGGGGVMAKPLEETVSMDREKLEGSQANAPTAEAPANAPTAAAPVGPPPPPAAKLATQTNVPGVKQTIKLRPSSVGGGVPGGAVASSAPTQEAPAPSPKTIKLKPKSAGPEVDDPNAKTADIPAAKAPTAHLLTPSSPTRVEPSAPTIDAAPAAAPAKRTIKLMPTKKGGPEPTVNAADPTVEVAQPAGEGAEPAPAMRLVKTGSAEPGTSDPTVEMPGEEPADPGAEPSSAPSRKLGIRKTAQQPQAEPGGQATPGPKKAPDEDGAGTGADEPSIIFTLASCFTLAALGFLMFMLFTEVQKYVLK
jgi:hypothetical protein